MKFDEELWAHAQACSVSDETLLDAAAILRRAARLVETACDEEFEKRREFLEEAVGTASYAIGRACRVIEEEKAPEKNDEPYGRTIRSLPPGFAPQETP